MTHTFFFPILGMAAAYVLGSIPSSVWVGRRFFGIDVRQHGSGNAGATNTFRVLGKKAGTVVLIMDIAKGWLAAQLPFWLVHAGSIEQEAVLLWQMVYGFIAVLGHVYSVFLQFKGGKGVATSLGVILALHTWASLLALLVFLVVLLLSHYVSLGSMIAAFIFSLSVSMEIFREESFYFKLFVWLMFALVIYTHRSNIRRLQAGKENKVYLFGIGKPSSD